MRRKQNMKKKQTRNKQKEKISKSMTFQEIMEKHPELAETLFQKGMHCIGCPAAMQETLEQGSLVHGLNPDKIEKELNEKLKKEE